MKKMLTLILMLMVEDLPPPLQVKPTVPATITIATGDGVGFPVVTQLCDAITSADEVGNWFCLKGDGTMATGSQITLSKVGTVTAETQRFCPNGPDCLPSLRQLRTGAASSVACDGTCDHGYESADLATGTSDITVCQEILIGSQGYYENYFHKGTTANGIDYLFQKVPGSQAVGLYVGAGSLGNITLTLGVRHLVCMTVVAGTGTAAKGFLDGVRVINTTATTTNNTGGWRVSGYASGNFPVREQSAIGDTFVTRTVLSEARIAALAHSVLADQPTTKAGDVIETDRSTVRSCESSDGQVVSIITANRACISNGRFQVRKTATSYTTKSAEFDSAPWALNASASKLGTLTVDYAVAPNGTKTADRIQLPAITGSGQYSRIYATGLGAIPTTPGSACLLIKGTSASGQIGMSLLTGYGTTGWTTCSYTTSWTTCRLENKTVAAGGTENIYLGNDFANDGAQPATDFVLAGFWFTAGSSCGAYIPTYTANVQHVQEVDFKFPNATLIANGIGTAGCFSADFVPHGTTSSIVAALGWMSNTGRALYVNSTVRTYDGTNEPAVSGAFVLNTPMHARATWSGSSLNVYNVTAGTSTAGSFDGTMTTTGYPSASYFTFCSASAALGAAVADYECGNVRMDANPSRCP